MVFNSLSILPLLKTYACMRFSFYNNQYDFRILKTKLFGIAKI